MSLIRGVLRRALVPGHSVSVRRAGFPTVAQALRYYSRPLPPRYPNQLPATATKTTAPPVDLAEFRKRDPLDRLRDPSLRFDGEDDVPTEYDVIMKGMLAHMIAIK
jgi:hypothetical protein